MEYIVEAVGNAQGVPQTPTLLKLWLAGEMPPRWRPLQPDGRGWSPLWKLQQEQRTTKIASPPFILNPASYVSEYFIRSPLWLRS